jgi:hypothetical protein
VNATPILEALRERGIVFMQADADGEIGTGLTDLGQRCAIFLFVGMPIETIDALIEEVGEE